MYGWLVWLMWDLAVFNLRDAAQQTLLAHITGLSRLVASVHPVEWFEKLDDESLMEHLSVHAAVRATRAQAQGFSSKGRRSSAEGFGF